MKKITKEYLKKRVYYDKNTGVFKWKDNTKKHNKGDIAGYLRGVKNVVIGFGSDEYSASKLAWLYVYDEYPKKRVYHKDGDTLNLKINNLYLHGEKKELTQEYLKEILNYNQQTGIFTWNVFRNQNAKRGDIAGCIGSDGYSRIKIQSKGYLLSRLAWLFMEGYLPENEIDHINRNIKDNSWSNLRQVSRRCNSRNQKLRKTNTTGVTGITNRKGKFQARITNNDGIRVNLGWYERFDLAVMARWKAELKYNYPNCQTKSNSYLYLKNMGLI